MDWTHTHRISRLLQSAHWIPWLGAVLLAIVAAPLLREIDERTQWNVLGFGLQGARALLGVLAGSMLSMLLFLMSALLIVIQLSSTQLTPRVIAVIVMRGGPVKYSIAFVVFSFLLPIGVLGRSEESVLQLSTAVCLLASLVSLGLFLFLVDFTLKALRPVSVAAKVAAEGHEVVQDVYPYLLGGPIDPRRSRLASPPGAPVRTVLQADDSLVLTAVDFQGLSSAAISAGGLVELVPRVGEFVAAGEPLFHLHGGAARLDDRALCACLAFGLERTMEQDPMFAFRILVDIASKALSPAINDPTTAVLALDQIHRLLRSVGRRQLDTEALLDERGTCGVFFHTPDWDDYVILAVSETRQFGQNSIQVVRRLRAMLENLIATLPESRRPPLEDQLRMLERAIEREFPDEEDRRNASAADPQGLGHVA